MVACLSSLGWALAQPHDSGRDGVSGTLLEALRAELDRNMRELRLDGLARPHFIAYSVRENVGHYLSASFGALGEPRTTHTRTLEIDLRVGERAFDSSHYVGQDPRAYRPQTTRLAIEDDLDSLRFSIWALTDSAYKAALETLSQKRAYQQSRNIVKPLPDLSKDPVHSMTETGAEIPYDAADWGERLRRASAAFLSFPRIHSATVHLALNFDHVYFVDSEGRTAVYPDPRFEVRLWAEAQAEDGMVESDERRFLSPDLAELPSAEALELEARQLARDLDALTRAPQVETYLGPVLLEGPAAGEFFNQLLATGLASPRSLWIESEWAEKYFLPGSLTPRVGLRVVAPILDVVDDPTRVAAEGRRLAGHYPLDSQGIPPQPVQLVEHGILRDLLTSRAPLVDRPRSNGHGRGGFGEPVTARIGNLIVQPTETKRLVTLRERLRQEAKAFGLDYGIVVRRLRSEQRRQDTDLLAAPVLAYRVDVETGQETLFRDARFHAVTLRALRDVIGASKERYVHNVYKQGPFQYTRGEVPASIVHPAILLSEMELKRTDDKPQRLPYLARPEE